MRNLVQPPPSTHCDLCNGELQLKTLELDPLVIDGDVQIFICSKCGHESTRKVIHDPYAAHTAASLARDRMVS
jgi:predicted metalloprotease